MGSIFDANSYIDAVAFVEQASDPATIATRWLLYPKSDGMYQKSPAGTALRLLTTADVPGSGAAPADATYITQTPNSGLSNEQALSTLATGAMQVTTATGVVSSRPNGVTSTATAAGTTTLTAASEQTQVFTGTTTQTCVLPDATTLAVGWIFRIRNTSTGAVTVNANGGGLVVTLAASQEALFICTDIGSAAGTWSMSAVPPTGAFTTLSAFTTGSFPFTMTSDGSSSGFANAAYNGSGTATNNDPRVLFRRAQGSYNSPSAVVNNDRLGAFNWQGWDGDEFYTAAAIFAFVNGTVANDSVPARMTFELIRAAGATSRSEYMGFKGTETVFNDGSADIDFRVESDGNANAFVVDAGTDRVGIGKSSPATVLDVLLTDSGTNAVVNVLTVGHNGGTPTTNFGTGMLLQGESSTTNAQDMARWRTFWDVATHASRSATAVLSVFTSAGETDVLTLTSTGVNLSDLLLQRPVLKDYGEATSSHGNMGSTETFDLTDGNVQTGTLNADCIFTFSNPAASGTYCSLTLYITQDGTGGWNITYPASVDWGNGTPPTLSTTPGALNRLFFDTIDGGTTWNGFLAGKDFA